MVFAHIAGVPVEELLPSLLACGGLVGGRVWVALRGKMRQRCPTSPSPSSTSSRRARSST